MNTNNDELSWQHMILSWAVLIIVVSLAAWGIKSCIKIDDEDQRQSVVTAHSNTVYNLQHPIILGTNENGEVVKKYYIEDWPGGWVYEIGKTKTEITPHGKFPATTTISVEESK